MNTNEFVDTYIEFLLKLEKHELREIANSYRDNQDMQPLFDALDRLIGSNKNGLRKKAYFFKQELRLARQGITQLQILTLRDMLDRSGSVDEFLGMISERNA
jgi:hypothetical protein